MSRIAKYPIQLPADIEFEMNGQAVRVKGPKGELHYNIHDDVEVTRDENVLTFKPRKESKKAWAQAGTTRANINNMLVGVKDGFERKLELVGVGYRAQAQGKVLNLTLGFSHPINFEVPEEVTIETPTQTEVVVKGVNKQVVGQIAAEIRGFRPPEPYKGKGVKYADETIIRKEAKKK